MNHEKETPDIMQDSVNDIEVRVAEDSMAAYITVNPTNQKKEFTVEELLEVLTGNQVVVGVKREVLEEIVEKKLYFKEFLIAQGEEPVFGKSGYYEIPFSFEFDSKPKILEDGSVDYNQFDNYCRVSDGDVIAIYHPATKGRNGINVLGKKVFGKNGKEQLPLKGKGFKIDEEDSKKYIAIQDGRLEYVENRSIDILNHYDVDGDVNHATGDIQFPGDIHIKGNVTAGAVVKATGQIIVDGHVEAGYLYAGRDIVLKNGVQGAGKSRIEAGGNISAKFFEQAVVKAEGMITAGSVVNCDIESKDRIIISGRIGALLGGRTWAISYIEANILGNMVEAKTFVKVGGGSEMYAEAAKTDESIRKLGEELEKINETIEKVELAIRAKQQQFLTDKKMELIRIKYKKTSELDNLLKKKKELTELMEKSERARIKVNKSIFPRVTVNINDIVYINKTENYNVHYEKRGGDVVAIANA